MKWKELGLVMVINTLLLIQQAILAPVLPLEVTRRQIDQKVIGSVLGCFSLGWIIAPFILPALYQKHGRRKLAKNGVLITMVALLCYAFLYFIPDKQKVLFSVISCVARLVEGLGVATSVTAISSLVTLLHHDERDRVQAARVFGTAIGVASGIAIGAALYKLLGYFWLFACFSAILPIPYILMNAFP